jgi:hypothetical protein
MTRSCLPPRPITALFRDPRQFCSSSCRPVVGLTGDGKTKIENRTPRTRLAYLTRYRVGVHVVAISESVAAVGTLDLEAELLVERDADRVSNDK